MDGKLNTNNPTTDETSPRRHASSEPLKQKNIRLQPTHSASSQHASMSHDSYSAPLALSKVKLPANIATIEKEIANIATANNAAWLRQCKGFSLDVVKNESKLPYYSANRDMINPLKNYHSKASQASYYIIINVISRINWDASQGEQALKKLLAHIYIALQELKAEEINPQTESESEEIVCTQRNRLLNAFTLTWGEVMNLLDQWVMEKKRNPENSEADDSVGIYTPTNLTLAYYSLKIIYDWLDAYVKDEQLEMAKLNQTTSMLEDSVDRKRPGGRLEERLNALEAQTLEKTDPILPERKAYPVLENVPIASSPLSRDSYNSLSVAEKREQPRSHSVDATPAHDKKDRPSWIGVFAKALHELKSRSATPPARPASDNFSWSMKKKQ